MNWHQYDTWLDDYVDGATSAAATRDIEVHLASCVECRAMVADVRTIRSMSRSLEPHTPPAHVWPRIAAAIESEPKAGSFFLLSAFGLPQAAVLVMATGLTTGLWWIGDRLTLIERPDMTAAAPSSLANNDGGALQVVEEEFASTIFGLEQATGSQQALLDPATADVLQANLSVIDVAIDQSRTVLAAEPESELAQESLFEALRNKVAVLQEMLALINEMRKGNPETAARIVSGLNQ